MAYSSPPPRKRFGQHFLQDQQVLEDIYHAVSPKNTDHIVEIGPGHGELTELFIAKVKRLDLIEIDRDLVPLLRQRFSQVKHVFIHEADALKFPLQSLTQSAHSLRIIGNLPYNISTPLLFKLFESQSLIQDMHCMLQKEVADRLTEALGGANYGRLTVMSQYYCENTQLFWVPPEAFNPPPKVMSAVIRLVPIIQPLPAQSLVTLQDVVRESFNHRRKTLSNGLKKLITAQELINLGIDPLSRPQQTWILDFIKISNYLAEKS